MSQSRINESELLINNGFLDGGFYLSGYAIEFALKAVICKRLSVEMFDKNDVKGDISKPFCIHNPKILVVFAGLRKKLEEDKASDNELSKAWNKVSEWSEERRYEPNCQETTAKEFLKAVKTFRKWVEPYW